MYVICLTSYDTCVNHTRLAKPEAINLSDRAFVLSKEDAKLGTDCSGTPKEKTSHFGRPVCFSIILRMIVAKKLTVQNESQIFNMVEDLVAIENPGNILSIHSDAAWALNDYKTATLINHRNLCNEQPPL